MDKEQEEVLEFLCAMLYSVQTISFDISSSFNV
jgi:hypothetical protein